MDTINPNHYTNHPSGVECIQITEHMDFLTGNAVKYLWRAGMKDDKVQDLEKAKWYIQRLIDKEEQIKEVDKEGNMPEIQRIKPGDVIRCERKDYEGVYAGCHHWDPHIYECMCTLDRPKREPKEPMVAGAVAPNLNNKLVGDCIDCPYSAESGICKYWDENLCDCIDPLKRR